MARLTTHVLDLVRGVPAAGVQIELKRLLENSSELVVARMTNADGRCDAPLLEGEELAKGTWELNFHVAEYFVSQGQAREELPFLDVVSVRFCVSDPDQSYHVPLLVTPWSYSTYRGS